MDTVFMIWLVMSGSGALIGTLAGIMAPAHHFVILKDLTPANTGFSVAVPGAVVRGSYDPPSVAVTHLPIGLSTSASVFSRT